MLRRQSISARWKQRWFSARFCNSTRGSSRKCSEINVSWTSGHIALVASSIVAARSKVVRRSSSICLRKSTDSREKVRIISRPWDIYGGLTYLGDLELRPERVIDQSDRVIRKYLFIKFSRALWRYRRCLNFSFRSFDYYFPALFVADICVFSRNVTYINNICTIIFSLLTLINYIKFMYIYYTHTYLLLLFFVMKYISRGDYFDARLLKSDILDIFRGCRRNVTYLLV